jgi:single-stranded-DNA-specific exonuclease
LLEGIEACSDLFSRYGGHSHACGFAMPAANIEQLRARLDAFARTRLTMADFDPVLDVDAELRLEEVTPELYQALQLLEPYGVGNREPIFSAVDIRLCAPPRILKEKHIKLKLMSAPTTTEPSNGGAWRRSITYDAMGWRMAEVLEQSPLLAGDALDIAFTIGSNDHPEYGGLELTLQDLRSPNLARPPHSNANDIVPVI